MAKIKKIICERAENDYNTFMQIEVGIDINAEGMFTTTLSETDAKTIASYGVDLARNRAGRGRIGFFENETLAGLLCDIRKVLRACLNYKIVSVTPVIKYNLNTFCDYCTNNQTGDIVPNGRFVGDGNVNWKEGTAKLSHFEEKGFGIKVSARPYMKRVVEYGNGKQKIFYDRMIDCEEGSYMEWLNELCNQESCEYYKREIAGTEENAHFFVMIIKQICRINEQIGEIIKNDMLEDLIQSTPKLEVFTSIKQQSEKGGSDVQ